MTGLKEPEDIVRGAGIRRPSTYVTKPVNIAELLARVRIHIANSRVAFGARVALDATGPLSAGDRRRGARCAWDHPAGGQPAGRRLRGP